MTKREIKRLQKFVSEHKEIGRSFQLYIITQQGEFVNQHHSENKRPHQLITDKTVLGVPFNQVKRIIFYISTRYNTFYF